MVGIEMAIRLFYDMDIISPVHDGSGRQCLLYLRLAASGRNTSQRCKFIFKCDELQQGGGKDRCSVAIRNVFV